MQAGRPQPAAAFNSRFPCINRCIYLCAVNPALFSFWIEGSGAVLVGYMRVSTAEQNLALQRDALQAAGCERVYDDTCSGSVTDRPGLSRALDALREGDALVVWKLDRIGRSLAHVVELVGALQTRGVGLKVLTGGIDTTSCGRAAWCSASSRRCPSSSAT